MRFVYEGTIPAEVRQLAESYEAVIREKAPSWMRQLSITFNYADSESVLTISCQHEYRRACFNFCPGFLNHDEVERRASVLHEIGHLHVLQVQNTCREMVEYIKSQNKDLGVSFERRIKADIETFCEDFGNLI